MTNKNINYVKFEDWHDKHENSEVFERMLGIKKDPEHKYIKNPVSSPGIWSIKLNSKWGTKVFSGGCYGAMNSTPGFKDVEGIRITLWNNDPSSVWWIEKVLNPKESPWAMVLDEIGTPTIYLGNGAKTNSSIEDAVHSTFYGVLEFNVKNTMSFRNFMSMMIALRQTRVEPGSIGLIKRLYDLKKKEIKSLKFSEVVAIAIMTTKRNGRRSPFTQMFMSGNGWLGSVKNTSPRHVARRVFAKSDAPFSGCGYYPSDASWGDDKEYNAYCKFLQTHKKEDVNRIFKFLPNLQPIKETAGSYTISFEDFLKFLREKSK